MGKRYGIAFILLLSLGCRDPFIPDAQFGETNFLVVEGYINIGPGVTRIRLSRTTPINQSSSQVFESGALVSVEGADNSHHSLNEMGDGVYSADLHLPSTTLYRLRITVHEGKEYLSDFTSSVITPSIDSLRWHSGVEGVTISLATHDETNQTRYYQFEYEETWEIRSFFLSLLTYEKRQLSYRSQEEIQALFRCWKSASSPDLTLYSTATQTLDVIPAYPIIFIPANAERISQRYSILVKQHGLSREAYEYLVLMKKNTGPLGSFADPQPATLNGNIHCTTADEPVIGYIGAFTTEEVRIFINRSDVPLWNYDLACKPIKMLNHPDTLAKYLTSGVNLATEPAVVQPGGNILELYRAPDICTDCRRLGGNNIEPDYWN